MTRLTNPRFLCRLRQRLVSEILNLISIRNVLELSHLLQCPSHESNIVYYEISQTNHFADGGDALISTKTAFIAL